MNRLYIVLLVLAVLVPVVFAETATDYYVQPSNVLCSDSGVGGNWDETVCSGTYTSGVDACGDALVSCDDANAESFVVGRNTLMGVDVGVADLSVDPEVQCDSILGARIEYRYAADAGADERILNVSSDAGASWQEACGGVPGAEGVTNSCDVSSIAWTCEDFFGEQAQARARLTAFRSGGPPSATYELSVNYLVFFVDYNFTINPLETDLTSYQQGGVVNITGADVWGASEDVTINVTLDGVLLDQLFVTTDAQGHFATTYELGDYAPTGLYVLSASQDSDSSINAQTEFSVNAREPVVTTQRPGGYYNRSETATFLGEEFASNSSVLVQATNPSGETILETSIVTSAQGTFSFSYVFEDAFTTALGNYTFTFTEQLNESYQAPISPQLVVLPQTATRSTDSASVLSELSVLDGDFARFTATNGQEDFFEISYFEVFPLEADIDLLAFEFFHRESDAGADVYVKWLNPSTSNWEVVSGCVYEGNLSARWNSCDLTSVVSSVAQANDLQVRISDDEQTGGSSNWNYDVDIAFLQAAFTLEPGIFDVQATNVTTRSAAVSWQTQKSTNSTVRYGLTPSLGSVLSNSSLSSSHSFLLEGLDDDSTYYYVVESCTEYSCETQGPFTFTTQEETAPTISDFSVEVGVSEANFSWVTDRNTTSEVFFGTSSSYGSSLSNSTSTDSHSFLLSGLSASTTYYFLVESCDELGCASASGSFKTAPPVGACSLRYAEKAADHEEGIIKRGDVVVIDCRLASALQARADLRVQLAWPSELLSRLVSAPRLLYQEPEVLYP